MKLLAIALLLALPPEPPSKEAALLQCAQRLFDASGDQVWPEWSRAPFFTLLVVDEREFLFAAAREVPGFARQREGVFHRARTFDPKLLATFPVYSKEPVIVVGTTAATEKSDTAWLLTLLHEHFHQLQYSQPWYYEKTAALNLAKGDTSGMWMLNYDFPYDEEAVQASYETFSRALRRALDARGTERFAGTLDGVKSSWRALRESLDADDDAYMRFQMWQEGVARYAELRMAQQAEGVACVKNLQPPASRVASDIVNTVHASLENPRLGETKRVAFYAAGAAIAMLLDEANPGWKTKYFERPFEIEAYFGF